MRKNDSGVTLIALIITIIVLLILAGVTIAMIMGDNGILNRAVDAADRTEEAKANEQEILNSYEDLLNGKSNNTDSEAGKLAGEGTETSPYLIESIEDLVAFSDLVEGTNKYGFNEENEQKTFEGEYVQLATTLDFNSINSYKLETSVQSGGLKDQLTSGKGFLSIVGPEEWINETTGEMKVFLGTFDGNTKEIRNLYQNINDDDKVTFEEDMYILLGGLFGVTGGTIKNLGITGKINVELTSLEEYDSISVGGIAGLTLKSITNCYTDVNITAISSTNLERWLLAIGGIAGWAAQSELTECYNLGDITTEGDIFTGGITGFIQEGVTVSNCYNKGTVSGTKYTGGIIGYFDYGSIENCYNVGIIEGTGALGGVAGHAEAPRYLKNSYCLDNVDNLYGSYGLNNLPINCAIKTEEQLKATDNTMIDLLNQDLTTPAWEIDTNNINEGYPILSWQVD